MTGVVDPAPPGGAPTWYADLDEEGRGYVANKGWDKLDPVAAAKNTVAAYRQLEKHMGMPADQIAVVPKDPSDPRWADLYQRLGAPKDATGYVFDDVKSTKGATPEQDVIDFARAVATELHMPVGAAKTLVTRIMDFGDKYEAEDTAAVSARLGAQEAELRRNWGAAYDHNNFIANKAADALGMSKEVLQAVIASAGLDKTMEAFRQLGARMGEPEFLRGQGGAGGLADPTAGMTRDQAVGRKAALMSDNAWAARFINGGAAEQKEMENLNRIIVGPETDYQHFGRRS